MKICVVGCGNQGTGYAGLLAQEEGVEQIVLADRDINRAKRAVSLIKSLDSKVKVNDIQVAEVDARNQRDVSRIARGTDVIFNGILPCCNIPIMQASLSVGAHYLDLLSGTCELPGTPADETVEAQLELDKEFREADITAFPCLGLSPGWVNLASQHILNQFDTVDSVLFRGLDWIESRELLALSTPSLQLGLYLGAPYPARIENGEIVKVDLVDSEEIYEFPEPVGRKKLYAMTMGIDSILALKFAGKPIRFLEEKGAVLSGGRELKDILLKVISAQTAKHPNAEQINLLELFGSSFKLASDLNFMEAYEDGSITDGAVAASVVVSGTIKGQPVRHTANYISTLKEALKHLPWAGSGVYGTVGGLPLELTLMLGRGEFTHRGVITAFKLDNHKVIYQRLSARGHRLTEKIEKPMEL